MKTKTIKIFSLIILTFLFCARLGAQDNFKLKYSYKNGETYVYNTSLDMNTTLEMMGQEMKTGNIADAVFKLKVDDIEKNNDMVFTSSIESGVIKVHSPMKDTTISLDMINGKRTKYTISELGKIKSREIIDTISDPVLKSITNQGFFRMFILPENQVKIGDTWSDRDSVVVDGMGGKIVNLTNTTSTLAGKEEKLGYKCLKITFTGDVKSGGEANVMNQKVLIEGTGKISGTVYFEPVKGIFVYSESLTDMNMTMATTGQQNMIIPLTQSVKSTLSLK